MAESEPQLSIFVDIMHAAEEPRLIEAITAPESTGTVLAPTNFAFERMAALLGVSLENFLRLPPQTLAEIVLYHIVPGHVIGATEFKHGDVLPTLSPSGQTLEVSFLESVLPVEYRSPTAPPTFVAVGSDAGVVSTVKADLEAGESLIHMIDHVLLPFAIAMPEIQTPLVQAYGEP